MDRKKDRRKLIIASMAILLIAAVSLWLFISAPQETGSYFDIDYSAGAEGLEDISSSANSNVFEVVNLNPFREVPA